MVELTEIPAGNLSLSKRKPLYGVGINDSNYVVSRKGAACSYYKVWKGVIERCYSKKFHDKYPSYIGCTVCDEWLLFSNFKSWMQSQDWKGKQIDKDILVQGNKMYSPSNCIFVTHAVNSLFTCRERKRGKYNQGVHVGTNTKKYKAQCSYLGVINRLGTFDSEKEAFDVYKKFKYGVIRELALDQDEPLRSAMLNYKIIQSKGA